MDQHIKKRWEHIISDLHETVLDIVCTSEMQTGQIAFDLSVDLAISINQDIGKIKRMMEDFDEG
jgi:hypothetical protein